MSDTRAQICDTNFWSSRELFSKRYPLAARRIDQKDRPQPSDLVWPSRFDCGPGCPRHEYDGVRTAEGGRPRPGLGLQQRGGAKHLNPAAVACQSDALWTL